MRKCEDPEGPNLAYEPPQIIKGVQVGPIGEEKIGTEQLEALREALFVQMEPGEKIYYERCSVCHAPREVSHYTRQQWQGITQSMFPRAGLDDEEARLVLDFLMKNAADAH